MTLEMNSPSADEDQAVAKPAALVTYVVQQLQVVGELEADGVGVMQKTEAWLDIATVRVPPRTKRRVVIRQALQEAGIKPGEVTERLRALDVDSAEVLEFEPHQPDPEWRAS